MYYAPAFRFHLCPRENSEGWLKMRRGAKIIDDPKNSGNRHYRPIRGVFGGRHAPAGAGFGAYIQPPTPRPNAIQLDRPAFGTYRNGSSPGGYVVVLAVPTKAAASIDA